MEGKTVDPKEKGVQKISKLLLQKRKTANFARRKQNEKYFFLRRKRIRLTLLY